VKTIFPIIGALFLYTEHYADDGEWIW